MKDTKSQTDSPVSHWIS